mmetsp:Transcript_10741/g.25377  ORF Transcript_10741/g.25377 Transcript_10741/m.25377 type:complete len:242 (+) Transcript_10741:336-1061(+)
MPLQVCVQRVRPEHLGVLLDHVGVVFALEERLLLENEGGEHGAGAPDVEGVVVPAVVQQELRALEVPGSDFDVVVLVGVVVLAEAHVHHHQLPLLCVVHCVLGFDIAVEDAAGVDVGQPLQELVHVVPHVVGREAWVLDVMLLVVDHLDHDALASRLRVFDEVDEVEDVRSALDGVQQHDLTLHLAHGDGDEALDRDALPRRLLRSKVRRPILACPELVVDFVVIWRAPHDCDFLVIFLCH